MEACAEDNFKSNENGKQFSRRVENSVGKGEIACSEQFLHFSQCFERLVLQTCKNKGLFEKRLNELILLICLSDIFH